MTTKSPPELCSEPIRSTKSFTGERSYLSIGDGNKIREHYTISRGTQAGIRDTHRQRELHHDFRSHCA